jgi:Bacterial Ig-like domain (group 3)
VRGIRCRGLRLELVAGLGIALAMPALTMAAEGARTVATQTTLSAEMHDQGGRTQATLAVTVTGEDGLPATGTVAIKDFGKELAGAVLNVEGKASVVLALRGGDHQLTATYSGDAVHKASVSNGTGVHAQVTGTADFQISIVPATLSLTAGQAGTVIATITPENATALAGPMFVTLSCSGNPDQSSCAFTPENVQIVQNAVKPVTSSMVFQTQTGSPLAAAPPARANASPIAWAFLLPGALGLVGLAWGTRRRRWLNRLSMLALVGLVTVLGTTGCNPRYFYLNHGPPLNPPTPAGTYTLKISAQSTNGVSAITHSTTMALTVK